MLSYASVFMFLVAVAWHRSPESADLPGHLNPIASYKLKSRCVLSRCTCGCVHVGLHKMCRNRHVQEDKFKLWRAQSVVAFGLPT